MRAKQFDKLKTILLII